MKLFQSQARSAEAELGVPCSPGPLLSPSMPADDRGSAQGWKDMDQADFAPAKWNILGVIRKKSASVSYTQPREGGLKLRSSLGPKPGKTGGDSPGNLDLSTLKVQNS